MDTATIEGAVAEVEKLFSFPARLDALRRLFPDCDALALPVTLLLFPESGGTAWAVPQQVMREMTILLFADGAVRVPLRDTASCRVGIFVKLDRDDPSVAAAVSKDKLKEWYIQSLREHCQRVVEEQERQAKQQQEWKATRRLKQPQGYAAFDGKPDMLPEVPRLPVQVMHREEIGVPIETVLPDGGV